MDKTHIKMGNCLFCNTPTSQKDWCGSGVFVCPLHNGASLADIEKLANTTADKIIKKMQSQPKKEKIPFPEKSIDEDGSITMGGA